MARILYVKPEKDDFPHENFVKALRRMGHHVMPLVTSPQNVEARLEAHRVTGTGVKRPQVIILVNWQTFNPEFVRSQSYNKKNIIIDAPKDAASARMDQVADNAEQLLTLDSKSSPSATFVQPGTPNTAKQLFAAIDAIEKASHADISR